MLLETYSLKVSLQSFQFIVYYINYYPARLAATAFSVFYRFKTMSKEEAERAKEEWNGIKREVKKRKKRDNILSALKVSKFNRTPEILV